MGAGEDALAALVATAEEGMRLGRTLEAILAAQYTISAALTSLTRVAEIDAEVAPELIASGEALMSGSAALERAGMFVQARYDAAVARVQSREESDDGDDD